MARSERYVVGLDVGTSQTVAIVAEAMEDGSLDIVGVGTTAGQGIRRGVVTDVEAAVSCIKGALQEAELMAGVEIDSVHLGFSGGQAVGCNSRGVAAVAGKTREITRADVDRAIAQARAVSLDPGREILHVLPQNFEVDEQPGITAPIGMTGASIKVDAHIVHGSVSVAQNVVACVNRAGVSVVDTTLEPLAAAEAVLTPDEKDLGVVLVDIGGGGTAFAVYQSGSLWHTGSIAVGGVHFRQDVGSRLRIPNADAEKSIRRYGCALASMVPEEEMIMVECVGMRRPQKIPRRDLAATLQPRAEEIFKRVWDDLEASGFESAINAGIVLTGGGAMLEGMPELARQLFHDLPIRCGCPIGVGGLADHVRNPAYATAVGLVAYAHRHVKASAPSPDGWVNRLQAVIKRYF